MFPPLLGRDGHESGMGGGVVIGYSYFACPRLHDPKSCGWYNQYGSALFSQISPLCQCLSEETPKAVGPFYLVSREIKDPTSPHWNV